MAVVNTKAAAVTAADTSPQSLVSPKLLGAPLREAVGVVAVANGDSIGSTLRAVRVPSRARISQVLLNCTAITSGAADIGVYETAANGGAAVDADFFASAQSIATAIVTNTDVTHEAGVYLQADTEKPLWQALALTADPNRFYDIVLTLTAAAAAAGSVSLKVRYADM